MRLFLRLIGGMAALSLMGCVSVLPEAAPPKPRFHITPANVSTIEGDTLAWSLVIDDPRATRVYDTVRIAVTPAPGRTEYLGGAEWADRAPRLFQTALVQTFEDAGRIIAVGDRNAIPVADLVLQTDIRRMDLAVNAGNEQAVVSIYARLSDGKGNVFAAKRFDARAVANSTKPTDVYAAFDNVFGEILVDLVRWSYEEGNAAQ